MIAHINPSVLRALAGRGYAGCLDRCFQGYRGETMQDLGYELPRIPIPRTWLNKGKRKKGRRTDQQRRTEQKQGARNASRLRALSCVSINAAPLLLQLGQRGRSLSTDAPPGRLVSVRTVVGDWDPTSLPRRR